MVVGANVTGSPVSLGILSGRSSNVARCAGTGLAHAHVGKEAAFTINCTEDTPPTVQVIKRIYYMSYYSKNETHFILKKKHIVVLFFVLKTKKLVYNKFSII